MTGNLDLLTEIDPRIWTSILSAPAPSGYVADGRAHQETVLWPSSSGDGSLNRDGEEEMEYQITELQKKSFEEPDEVKTPFEKGRIEVIQLGGLTFSRETLEPGWKWSKHVKPNVGTDSCQRYHVKYIVAGRQRVVMSDGTETILEPGDVAVIPPGHDAWVEGAEPNVLLELIGIVGT
jgi:quercetin dioxygenase-like cupin family protein